MGGGLEKFADIHFLLLHFVCSGREICGVYGLKKGRPPYHLLPSNPLNSNTSTQHQYPLCISSRPSPIPPAPPSSLLTPLPVL